MEKTLSRKLLTGAVAFFFAGTLLAGHTDFPTLDKAEFEPKDLEKGTLSVTRKDVDVSLRGKVRQDWIGYDKIHTLRASNDDQVSGFRSRSQIDLAATYGNQTYGRSAADAFVRLTNYGYWYDEGYYTHWSDGSKPLNMVTYMEEMWVNLHFGTFFKAYDNWFSYKKHPVSLKMGYFPYELGRGISMGSAITHIPFLGFDSEYYEDLIINQPSILIHGFINKNISYDLYYSKQGENSLSTAMTWETVNANRTDRAGDGFRRHYRGVAKDRDLWAARMDFRHSKKWGDLYVQPYMMYMDASELKIELDGDAASRLGTVGMMAEFKRGQFSMNAEVAGQFGHQTVHPIDRNQLELVMANDSQSTYVNSHIFSSDAVSETKAPNNHDLPAYANAFYNKGGFHTGSGQWVNPISKNGDQLTTDGSIAVHCNQPGENGVFGGNLNTYNSNVTGNKRFRDGYRNNYRGFMAAVDMKWEFEKVPVEIAGAGAYISGDKYPYNTEKDKRYKQFIPYGDANYIGKYVLSQVVLDARRLPRPIDISYRHQYAFNNDTDMGNLAYIGTGATWRPFKDRKKLMLQSNILWFWETTTLKKWGKEEKLPTYVFVNYDGEYEVGDPFEGDSWSSGTGGAWLRPNTDYETGWMDKDQYASRMLGTELNFEVQYRPVRNCIILGQLGVFIPGRLYKDLDGQPNVNTINGPKAAVGTYGLGHDTVWRAGFSLDYRF